MASRDALEALHTELLGEVQELLTRVDSLRGELPGLLTTVKDEAAQAAAGVKEAVEDFRAACIAMAEFVKDRKREVQDDLERSAARNATTVRRSLGGLRKWLWVIGLLGAVNLVLTLALVIGWAAR